MDGAGRGRVGIVVELQGHPQAGRSGRGLGVALPARRRNARTARSSVRRAGSSRAIGRYVRGHFGRRPAVVAQSPKGRAPQSGEVPVRVVERGGVAALRQTPKIIIGTGHSVKGGEADVVYVFPDLFPAGSRNWEGLRSERDAIVRLGYVMMTRARGSVSSSASRLADYMPITATASRVAAQTARKAIVSVTPAPVPDLPAPPALPAPVEGANHD